MWSIIKGGWSVLDRSMQKKFPWMLGSVVLLSALETLGISIVLPVVLLLVSPETVMDRPYVRSVYTAFGFQSARDFTATLVVVMLGALIVKNVVSIFIYRWQFNVTSRAAAALSNRLFENYLRMPYLETLTRDIGFFGYVVNSLGGIISSTFVYQVVLVVSETVTVAFLFAVLLVANPAAALSAICVLGIAGVAIYSLTARRLSRIGVESRLASERTLRLVNETFGNLKEVRMLGRGGRFLGLFQTETGTLAVNQATQMLYSASTRYLVEIAMLLAIATFVAVTLRGMDVAASVGLISLFGASALRILPSVARILGAMQTLRTLEAPIDLARRELVNLSGWQLESRASIDAPPPGTAREPVSLRLENIGFSYSDTKEPAIAGVTLDIPFGQSLGVVGASGSGKTTLADVVLGLITPTAGRVLANGKDIHGDMIAWRRMAAYVPQQIGFVAGTIRSNVALGLRDDEIDDARVRAVLETAQLTSLVSRLPQGVNSPIGEAGKLLSGGERQRLGIARALYQNASVLVLDEATSALDVETEDRFIKLLQNLKGLCTTIVIAHRLRTIRNCDRIALFDAGSMLAVDTFEKLSEGEPRFNRLVELSNLTDLSGNTDATVGAR